MRICFYVKFEGQLPSRWITENFEQFWNDLRERMLQYQLRLEWIIRD